MVFADPATERVVALACQVARADVPVLITGPNGAGKEKHRRNRPGQLGGRRRPVRHAQLRRAAVGADRGRAVRRRAPAPTPAPPARATASSRRPTAARCSSTRSATCRRAAQMKLLRVLETGRFQRLGSNREQQVKVRVISATNADLSAMIRAGQLPRGPLLPAQRDRAARAAAGRAPARHPAAGRGVPPPGKRLGAQARAALRRHRWPGNVRELRNAMQRAGTAGARRRDHARGPVAGRDRARRGPRARARSRRDRCRPWRAPAAW